MDGAELDIPQGCEEFRDFRKRILDPVLPDGSRRDTQAERNQRHDLPAEADDKFRAEKAGIRRNDNHV